MDSVLVEALVEAREALEEVPLTSPAKTLSLRREMLDKMATSLALTTAPPSHVARIAAMVLAVRDEAVSMREAHRVVRNAILEAMD